MAALYEKPFCITWTEKVERKEKKQVRNLTKPENAHEKSTVSRAKNLSAQNMLL